MDSDSDSEVDKENENVIQEVDKSKNQEQNDHIITELDNTEQSVVIPKVPLMALAIRNLKITIR